MNKIAIAVVSAVLVAGCGASHKPAPAASAAPAVSVTTVATGEVAPTRSLGGTVAPLQNLQVSSSLSEPALSVEVREGQLVHAGDVLARFDVSDLQAQLDADLRSTDQAVANATKQQFQSVQTIVQGQGSAGQAAAALAQAQEKLRLDQLTLARDDQLLAQEFIARQTVDQARQTVESDRQQVASAGASLASAQGTVATNGSPSSGLQGASIAAARAAAAAARAQARQVSAQIARATLRSPIDGVVVNRNLNPGEYPGSRTLFTIQQTGGAYALLNASAAEIAGIRAGDRADIVAAGGTAAAVTGRVEAVLGEVQPGATNFSVKVRLSSRAGALLSGMAVSGTVHLAPVRGLRIPRSAFVDGSESSVVAVVDSETRIVSVTKTADDAGYAVVRGPIRGVQVITNGNAGYANGQTVAAR